MAREGVPQEVYNSMCDLLINNCDETFHQGKIHVVKTLYEDHINSKRRLDNIQTLRDLIRVLEKRDCLSRTNVKILYEIADTLNTRHLLNYYNTSQNQKLLTETDVSLHHLKISTNPETNEEIIKQRIHKVLSEKLGRSWIDFARALNVPECKIDELKLQYPGLLRMCAVDILEYHASEAHPRVWRTELLEALRKARRNDIYNSVQKIIATYS